MKLRIKGNSLRLRITRPELERLTSGATVVEHVPFAPGAALAYELAVDPGASQIGATLEGNAIRVRIPAADFNQWKRETEVSLRATQPAGAESLALLIEKDFACLVERPDEDDSDAFAHPSGPKVC